MRFKIAYFTLVFLGCTALLSGQEATNTPNCATVKTGTFSLTDQSINYNARIIRNDSTQTEYNLNNGKTSTFKMIWLDQCSYKLALLKTDDTNPQPNMEHVIFKITKVAGSTLFFDVAIDLNQDKEDLTVVASHTMQILKN